MRMLSLLALIALGTAPAFAGPAKKVPAKQELPQMIVNSCTGQLMSLVSTAYAASAMYKTPVLNAADDKVVTDSMRSMKELALKIKGLQDNGKAPDKDLIAKVNDTFAKPEKIFRKKAAKELDLCLDYNAALIQECGSISQDDPKAQDKAMACITNALAKPEMKAKKEAFMNAAMKRLLISKK